MPKLTLQERRLQTLRRQLQNKPSSVVNHNPTAEKTAVQDSEFIAKVPQLESSMRAENTTLLTSDAYLKKDLTKVLILGTLAIAIELCLYSLQANHLIALKF